MFGFLELFYIILIFYLSAGEIKSKPHTRNDNDNITTSDVVALTNAIVSMETTTQMVIPTPVNIRNFGWKLWCKMQQDGHNCEGIGGWRYMFYYDTTLGDCKEFKYGNCPEAVNGFRTIQACHDNCRDVGERKFKERIPPHIYCGLQPSFGECFEYHPMFYYDITSRQCKGFSYSGCGGNQNRFATSQNCSSVCAPVMDFTLTKRS